MIITKHLATLHELETVYSYEDLLDMYEVITVNAINEEIVWEEAKRK